MDASAGMLSASAGPCGCRMDGLINGWMPDAVQTLCTYARVRPRWARPLGHLGLRLLGADGFLAVSAECVLDAPVRAAGGLVGSFLPSLLFSLALSACAPTLAFSLLVISSLAFPASLGLQLVPTLSSDLLLPSYHTTLSSRPMPCRHDVIRPLGLVARKGKGQENAV